MIYPLLLRMTVEEIIKDACLETNTNIKEYWEDKLISDFNEIYRKVRRWVVRVHEDYFWTYWTTDIQEWVTEYAIQRKEVEIEDWEELIKVPWIAKVKKVYILCWETYREVPQLDDFQERAWMKGWTLKDNHIILTREPDEDIENGLKLEGIQAVNDLDWESEEEDMFPWHEDLQDFTHVLTNGLKIKLWNAKQNFEKKQVAQADYDAAFSDMIVYISERVQDIYYTKLTY